MTESILTAYCGVDCSACPDYTDNKCPGCRQTEWREDDICFPVECCRKRGLSLCGECDQFPCSEMAEFYKESESHREAFVRMLTIRKDNGNQNLRSS